MIGEPGEPLTLALQGVIEPALRRLRAAQGERCFSDLSFANLYLFRAAHDYRYRPGAWPALSARGYDGARYLLPLFDLAQAPASTLLDGLREHDCYYPLAPGDLERVRALAPERLAITSARDDADYLYAASTFLAYAGRALSAKRGQLRQFHAACQPSARPFGPELEPCAREVLAGWMAQKDKTAGQADEIPCRLALRHAGALGLQGFVHFDRQQPIGFVLGETLAPGVCAIRFAKGLDSRAGLYPHMFQHFCQSFAAHFGQPLAWLNFEQDLGIAGLRRSKLSYQPAALLTKYRLTLRRAATPEPKPFSASNSAQDPARGPV